jgi:cytochrome P450
VFVIASMLGVQDFDLPDAEGLVVRLSRILDPLVSLEEYQSMDDIVRGLRGVLPRDLRGAPEQPGGRHHQRAAVGRAGHDDLQERDLAASARCLFFTGEETTVNLIGNGMLCLQRHPDAWARLRDEPDSRTRPSTSSLRFESPVQLTTRVAHEELDLHGIRVRAGDKMVVGIGAANRDPGRLRTGR